MAMALAQRGSLMASAAAGRSRRCAASPTPASLPCFAPVSRARRTVPAFAAPLSTPARSATATSAAAAEVATEAALPPAIFERVVELGVMKANLPWWKIVLMGLLAGVYVGFGGLLMLNVGISCPGLATTNPGLQRLVAGAVGLPFGLIMVLICGAELFTGNTCMVAAALYEGRIKASQLIKNWTLSYAANLVGGLALVYLVTMAGVAPSAAVASKVAVAKTSLTFQQAFVRGILANWLVNIAVWQATASTSVAGKVIGAIIPITTFVGIGLEHSVANMFLIPIGIATGAPVSKAAFLLNNLLPVTLGNIIGGAVCVAGAYAMIFGRAGNSASSAASA